MRSALEQAAWSAINKYQGSEIDVLLIDEITHFTETMYRFLRGRLRQVGVCFRASWSRNPGNIGHLWVKKAWIAGKIKGREYQMPNREDGMKRIYVPARLDDNPSLMTRTSLGVTGIRTESLPLAVSVSGKRDFGAREKCAETSCRL